MESTALRRRGLAVVVTVYIMLSLVFSEKAWSREKVRIGVPAGVIIFWPLYVAEAKGFYKDQDLEAEIVTIRSAPSVVQTLVAGDIDFAVVGTTSVLTAYLSGIGLVAVSGHDSKSLYEVYALPEINSISDLRNKPIVMGVPGGPPHMAMSIILRSAGLDIRKDIQAIYTAGGPDSLAALKARKVFAIMILPPFTFWAADEGYKKLAASADFLKENQNNIVAVSRTVLTKKPEKVKKFVNAVTKAIKFIHADRGEALVIIEKATKQPKDILEKTYDIFAPSLSEKINMKGISNIADYLKKWGVVKDVRDLEGFVDLRFISAGQ